MTGFTRALGVRCAHCHVGEEGQPFSEYDFVSDDNPNKRTARVMPEMLGTARGGQPADAIAIFRLNAESFPESGNARDSLAEAYMGAGERERAIVCYQKSLSVDPGNDNAVAMLERLRGEE